jgi:hypothetical protein
MEVLAMWECGGTSFVPALEEYCVLQDKKWFDVRMHACLPADVQFKDQTATVLKVPTFWVDDYSEESVTLLLQRMHTHGALDTIRAVNSLSQQRVHDFVVKENFTGSSLGIKVFDFRRKRAGGIDFVATAKEVREYCTKRPPGASLYVEPWVEAIADAEQRLYLMGSDARSVQKERERVLSCDRTWYVVASCYDRQDVALATHHLVTLGQHVIHSIRVPASEAAPAIRGKSASQPPADPRTTLQPILATDVTKSGLILEVAQWIRKRVLSGSFRRKFVAAGRLMLRIDMSVTSIPDSTSQTQKTIVFVKEVDTFNGAFLLLDGEPANAATSILLSLRGIFVQHVTEVLHEHHNHAVVTTTTRNPWRLRR